MIVKLYVWYDKIDKSYLADSLVAHRSERSVCRGFLNSFERDKKMRQDEYDLYRLGTLDDETGAIVLEPSPALVDVQQVFAPVASPDVSEE